MDDVARWPARDRADLFNAVAGQRNYMRAEIVEKDFWVCWTLKRLFGLEAPPAGLIFKGGTSLSKVYGVIARFSEDVDLSFDREALGFCGPNDLGQAGSKKKTEKKLDELADACRTMIREKLRPLLEETCATHLGRSPYSRTR
jgi:predicted nucleotidyltransferase component of viral defense system